MSSPVQSPGAAVAAPAHTIPFALRKNHVVLSASVNGHEGNLVLDTGSSATTLDRDWALGIGISAHERPVKALGIISTTVSLAHVGMIRVGTTELADETVALVPLDNVSAAHDVPIHGTLGYSFFARFAVEIDYPSSPPTVAIVRVCRRPGRRDHSGRPRIPDPGGGCSPRAGDRRLPFGATGARSGHEQVWRDPQSAVRRRTSLSARGLDVRRPGARRRLRGSATGRLVRLDRMEVGAYSVRAPLVALSETAGGFFDVTWADGTIGAPAYVDSNVIVDYARGRIIIELSRE